MWDVSERFLQSLGRPQVRATEVTVTPPGETEIDVSDHLIAGQVSADAGAVIRRKASLVLTGDRALFDLISVPGATIRVLHGLDYGGDRELVPVFIGEVQRPRQASASAAISLQCVDLAVWLSRTRYTTPRVPIPTQTRAQAIEAIVIAARPGTPVSILTADAVQVGNIAFTGTAADAVTALARDGGLEAFFRPDGQFIIRDRPTTLDTSVWTIAPGAGGTLKSADRERPMDRLYNRVVVSPASIAQTWQPQEAEVTDPNHPLHKSKIGIATFEWTARTAGTASQALHIARQLLGRVLGTTETLSLGAVSNPASDVSDVIRVITPTIGRDEGTIIQHLLDTFTLDLTSGSVQAGTRSEVVDDA